jgi:hypothetical protein
MAQFGELSLNTWLNTLPEVVPAVVATWESLCENQHAMFRCRPSTEVVWRAGIDSPGYLCKAESRLCGSSLVVVHHVKTRFVAAARNVPKRRCSRLHRARIVVPLVAQPIQDLSAVSITHKTVGVRLPRLRCGAGLVWPGPTDQPNGCPLLSPLLYMAGLGGCGIAKFSSLR